LQVAGGCTLAIKFGRLAHGNAELVLVQAGGDVRVRAGVNVGVYADSEFGGFAQMGGASAEHLQLGGAFHVEQENAGSKGKVDFLRQLADSGEDDLGGRLAANSQYALQFTAGHDIETTTQRCEQPKNREVRVGLHGVTDGVLAIAESFVELLVALAYGACRIDVQWRAVALGELVDRHSVGEEFAREGGPRTIVPAVGEGGCAFLRSSVAHFLAGGPFTLSATIV